MIALLLALAVVDPIDRGDADCEKPVAAKPITHKYPPKPVTHVYRPRRLFKSDPKPIVEEECDEAPRLAPLFGISIEPVNDQFSPVSKLALEGDDDTLSSTSVSDLQEPTCNCFAAWYSVAGGSAWVPDRSTRAIPSIPAVPEFPAWILMLGSAPFLYPAGRRGSSRFIKPRASCSAVRRPVIGDRA